MFIAAHGVWIIHPINVAVNHVVNKLSTLTHPLLDPKALAHSVCIVSCVISSNHSQNHQANHFLSALRTGFLMSFIKLLSTASLISLLRTFVASSFSGFVNVRRMSLLIALARGMSHNASQRVSTIDNTSQNAVDIQNN